jgi:predicted MFS family arabinose efflux permease
MTIQKSDISHKPSSLLQVIKESKPDNWSMLFSAFAASYGIGLLSMLALPFMVGTTIDGLGFSETQAGLLGTAEFLTIMVASLLVAPFMNRAPRRTLAIIGVVIAIGANLLCLTNNGAQFSTLLVFRGLAGLGCGLTLAVGNATVSNAKNPEKMAAHMSVLFVILMAITMLLFAWASGVWGYKGIFGSLAVCMLVVAPLLTMLPKSAPERSVQVNQRNAKVSLFSIASLGVLLAMFLFALRDMSGWAFVERIGLDVGYTGAQIGLLLSVQAVIGITGPLLASVIGSRFGLAKPLTFGIIASGLVYFSMLALPTSTLAYTIAAMCIGATYFFTLSYLTALAAELDSQGRIVAASGGFLSAGIAFGPLFGGFMVGKYGYIETSWAIFVMVILTLLFTLYAIRSLK